MNVWLRCSTRLVVDLALLATVLLADGARLRLVLPRSGTPRAVGGGAWGTWLACEWSGLVARPMGRRGSVAG